MKRNMIYNFLNKLFNMVSPFIISVYLARILYIDDIGRISYGKNLITYFMVLAMMGIQDYGIREVAKRKNDSKEVCNVFAELFIINIISTTFALVLYFVFMSFFSGGAIAGFVWIIVANYFNCDYLFLGQENFKLISIRNVLHKILFTAFVFVFVKTPGDAEIYIYGFAISQLLLYLTDVVFAIKTVRITKLNIDCFKHIKSILFLFGTAISLELYSQVDITMIGWWCNNKDVAVYSYSSKLVKMVVVMICSLTSVLLPRLSYLADKEDTSGIVKKMVEIALVLAVPSGVGAFAISYDVMDFLYGKSFISGGGIVRLMSPLIVICTLGNIFGTQVLISFNKEKKLLLATVVGALTNIVLNTVFIKWYGIFGAAIASVISEFVVMSMQIHYAKAGITVKIDGGFALKLGLSFFLLSASLVAVSCFHIHGLGLRLFFNVFIGAVVYLSSITLFGLWKRKSSDL